MPLVTMSPVFASGMQFTSDGKPLSGGKIYAYVGGSNSILKTTYANQAGSVANANPIVLNSSGRLPTAIWLISSETYNLVLTAPDGTTVLEQYDYVAGGVTQAYVDQLFATLSGLYLPITGGGITGSLSVLGGTALKNTNVVGTLAVSGTSTLGVVNATSVTATLNANSQKITNVITPTAATDAANKAYVDASGTDYSLPAGVILYVAVNAVPTGYLHANGDSVSRTVYSRLFEAIGTTFGSVDAGTFNLPDLRGNFIRGIDYGRGLDPSRTFGSNQTDSFESHIHNDITLGGSSKDNGDPASHVVTSDEELNGFRAMTGSFTGATGGTETRPVNIALLPIIKT